MGEITPTSVTQWKTLYNNEKCCVAAHAVDKDLTTPAAAQTDNGAAWIKLKFDETHFIHKIIIYYKFYTDWFVSDNYCAQSVENFKTCVDVDTNVDVSVYQGDVKQKSCGALQLTYGLEQSDQIYTLICNTEGDNVKLSKSAGYIVAYEVVVISTG